MNFAQKIGLVGYVAWKTLRQGKYDPVVMDELAAPERVSKLTDRELVYSLQFSAKYHDLFSVARFASEACSRKLMLLNHESGMGRKAIESVCWDSGTIDSNWLKHPAEWQSSAHGQACREILKAWAG